MVLAIFPLQAEKIDAEKAEKLAQNFVQSKRNLHSKPDVRLKYIAANRRENMTGQERIQRMAQQSALDTVYYYVFNINEDIDGGFVIVAGDDAIRPVLGYSFNGNYDENNLPPNFAYWMDFLQQEIAYAQEHNLPQSEIARLEWEKYMAGDVVYSNAVTPLLQTKWNQTAPYFNQCPLSGSTRTVTGCVATAMAQIMKYYEHPAQGSGQSAAYTARTSGVNVPSVNFGATVYDWNNMLNTYSGSANSTQQNAVATLMYHCGASVGMDYGTVAMGGSGASSTRVPAALTAYFGYDKTIVRRERIYFDNSSWETMLRTQIDAGYPVYYDGQGTGGHAFVCDGYDSAGKFHFNWGWGGLYDGYFLTTALNPGTGGTGSGSGTYNESQSIIINIKPDEGGVSAGYEMALRNTFSSSLTSATPNTTFSVSVGVRNIGQENYPGGSLGVGLINNDGQIVEVVGSRTVGTLSSGAYWLTPYSISCRLSNSVAHGQYKLQALVKNNTEDWRVITMATGCSSSINFHVENPGTVSVTGVTLNKTTLSLSVGNTEQLTHTIAPSNATNKNVAWSSNGTGVATVSQNGTVSAVSAGTAIITVATQDGGKSASCTVTVITVVNAASPNISVHPLGATYTQNVAANALTVTAASPDGGTLSYQWYSSATNKTTDGTPVGANSTSYTPSTATIGTTFYYVVVTNVNNSVNGIKTATATSNATAVTVSTPQIAVTDVTLNKTSLSLSIGDSEQLTATVDPYNASNKTVAWRSDNETVATVSNNGTVNAVANGIAIITVATQDGGKTANCVVLVMSSDIYVMDVRLNKTILSLTVGDSEQLTATVAPDNVSNKTVTWSSSREAVASVSNDGTITAVAAGVAIITVATQEGGKTANCVVMVFSQDIHVTDVSLNKTILSLVVGDSEQLKATIAPNNATNQALAWSSSAPGIANVNADGTVTALSEGSATIFVTTQDGNKEAKCNVTITPKQITGAEGTLAPYLNIYPNPFTGAVRLTGAEGCTLQVITAFGALVHTQMIISPDETVKLEHLQAGVYFFRLEKDGKEKTFKVVKD